MSLPTASSEPSSPRVPQISSRMTVGKASLLLALMIGVSRLTGFGRMVVTSHLYGVNGQTDAYNAAFNIPDTISIIIAGGALATGFVPVFTEYLSRGQAEAAQRTFRAMFTLLMVVFGALTVGLFALTYTPWGNIMAPAAPTLPKVATAEAMQLYRAALAEHPQNVELFKHLLRILLVAQFVFVIGGMFTGTLNALRLFWYPALQPVFFNCGIILFGLIGPKFFGAGIESQAWGALFGAVAGSALIQIPAIYRNHLSLKPLWDFGDPGVRRVMRSLLPIVFGLASGQIIAMNLPRFFAKELGLGAITGLDNANRLMQVPIDVLASGPAIALYPTLALLAAQGEFSQMRFQLAVTLRRILVMTMLATALLMALRVPLIQLLLQHGQFTPADTHFTATILACYALGVVGLSVQRLLARGFYAMGETRAPVFIGVAAMGLFLVFGYGVVLAARQMAWLCPLSPALLALAASLAISGMALWMGFALQRRLGGWDFGETAAAFRKGLIASLVAYGAAALMVRLISPPLEGMATGSFWQMLARTVILGMGGATGVVTFLMASAVLKIQEVEGLTKRLPGGRNEPKYFQEVRFPNPNEGAGL
jgi:putative peptidoglycan lipid II flippase